MTGNLTGTLPESTYGSLLHVDNASTGLSASWSQVYDGKGNSTTVEVSTAGTRITNLTILGTYSLPSAVPIASGGTGQVTATLGYDALSPLTTQGDTLYYNGTHNVRLAAGTSGYVLQTNGAGANPAWVASSTIAVTAGHSENGTAAVFDSANSTTATLQFNGISAGSNKVTIGGGGSNAAVTVDVVPGNIAISGLSGYGTAASQNTSFFLQTANNLSDVTAGTARTNLGLGTAAVQNVGFFCQVANNLSDVTKATAFNNLSPNTTEGDITYYTSSSNSRLAIGTANKLLTSNGTDPAWTAPYTQATLAFGATPVNNKSFTVSDAKISSGSKILITRGYNSDTDELDMDPMIFAAVPGSGSMTVLVRTMDGPVIGNYYINYMVG